MPPAEPLEGSPARPLRLRSSTVLASIMFSTMWSLTMRTSQSALQETTLYFPKSALAWIGRKSECLQYLRHLVTAVFYHAVEHLKIKMKPLSCAGTGFPPSAQVRSGRYFTCDFHPDELSILPVTFLPASEARKTKTSVTDSGLLPW